MEKTKTPRERAIERALAEKETKKATSKKISRVDLFKTYPPGIKYDK